MAVNGESLRVERELLTGFHLPESGRKSHELPSTPSLTLLSVISLANQFLQSSLPYQTLCSRLRSRRGVTSSLMEMSSEWKERKQLPDLDVIVCNGYAGGFSDCSQSVCVEKQILSKKIELTGRFCGRDICVVASPRNSIVFYHWRALRIDAVCREV